MTRGTRPQTGAVEAEACTRSQPARGRQPRQVLLLAAHPLDAVARAAPARPRGSTPTVRRARRLAVDERGQAQARRRAPAAGSARGRRSPCPPVSPGHEEDEVEPDVDHAAAASRAPARAGRRATASRTRARPARARRRPIRCAQLRIAAAGARVASANACGSSATSRCRPGSRPASPSQPSEVETTARPGRHRLDDLHADAGAGQDRHDHRRARRAKNGAIESTKPCTAMPSRPSSATHVVGRALADDVEHARRAAARARAATPRGRTSAIPS